MNLPAASYPLSHAQKRIYLTEERFPGTPFANIPYMIWFDKVLNFDLLSEALNILIARHDSLRLRIQPDENFEPRQYVLAYEPKQFPRLDFSALTLAECDRWGEEQARVPLSLSEGELWYFAFLRAPENKTAIFIKFHHIISDGWTGNMLAKELIRIYEELASGQEVSVEKAPSYIKALTREEEYKTGSSFAKDQTYWHDKFSSLPEDITFSFGKKASDSILSQRKTCYFSEAHLQAMNEFCQCRNATQFNLLMAGLAAFLHRLTGKEDMVVGIPQHGRSNKEEKLTAGMFVSTLPLRLHPTPQMTFTTLLESVGKEILTSIRHRQYPFDLLVEELQEKFGVVENFPAVTLVQLPDSDGEETFRLRFYSPGADPSPLTLYVNSSRLNMGEGGLELHIDYQPDVYDSDDIDRFFARLTTLIMSAVENPEAPLSSLTLLPEEEKSLLLDEFNSVTIPYPMEKTAPQLFHEQMLRAPDGTAVVAKGRKLTYRDLNARANQLAHILRQKGIGPDDIVGILAGRSLEMIIGAIAILKAGGAYMPIDPDYPADRIRHMLSDSCAKILLSQQDLQRDDLDYRGEWLDLNSEEIRQAPDTDLPLVNKSSDLVYIIYTSGSTGKPKGVMVEHRNLLSFCTWQQHYYGITPADSVAVYAALGFDTSIGSIFPPLLAGASIHMIPEEIRLSLEELNQYFETHKITIADLPTQFCEQFIEFADNHSLRYLITGGDRLKVYKPRNYKLINEYGPTECTVAATQFPVARYYDNIPIGRPFGNTRIYILDAHNNLQPLGIPGELCIAGSQLARGYYNRPDLTEEKFVADPFHPGEKMYRTGDLARWLPDGTIEFNGRIDFQVKIRGFRIELGEIEQQILRYGGIGDVVVAAQTDKSGNAYLCAYIVADREVPPAQLQKQLGETLPDYMIPPYILQLPVMPLTPNGKIDRKSLPRPTVETVGGIEYAAPRNELEEKLAELWQEILNIPRIGIDDNFFALGGHSLKASLLQAKLQKLLQIRLTLPQLFKMPTIREQSAHLSQQNRRQIIPLTRVAERDSYPLSAAQLRMFIMHETEEIGTAYNVSVVANLAGTVDSCRLEKALNELADRHEALRTYFLSEQGEPRQKILPSLNLTLEEVILSEELRHTSAELQSVIAGHIRPFDLLTAPLVRAVLFRLGENDAVFLLDIPHIIFDGMSLEVLLSELLLRYDDMPLPPAPAFRYRDFAVWQQAHLASDALKDQEEYWLKVFSGDLPIMQLPLDHSRPAVRSFAGDRIFCSIDRELADKLQELARTEDATLFMVLMAAFQVLLAKYSGQEDIVIGSPVSGRTLAELSSLVGMFVGTTALRGFPEGNKSFRDFLAEIRTATLGALDNQDYQFEQLVSRLEIPRDTSRNPLFDVMFVLQNTGDSQVWSTRDFILTEYPLNNGISQFDLTLDASETSAGLSLVWEYATDLFRPDTIRALSRHFTALLSLITLDAGQTIRDMDLVTGEERRLLLEEYNDTALTVPSHMTVHQLFEAMAAQYPEKPALVFQNTVYSYAVLNAKTNRLARLLRQQGLGPDKLAAIMVERSADIIIGALAVMKAGGAYLPIDPGYPEDRIAYMLEDSKAPVILTQTPLTGKLSQYAGKVLALDDPALYSGEEDSANLTPASGPENLVYVIYTSGSTGKPKGVMLEHRNLVNLCTWQNHYHEVTAADTAAAYSGFGFDASVWEMFPFLTCGATLHIIAEDLRLLPLELNRYFETHHITVTNLPTQICEQFMAMVPHTSLRVLVTGGDKLRSYLPGSYRLVNEYGPTEYTISATYFPVDRAYDNIPIGKPLANTWLYVLDSHGRLQLPGVPGELCIAGAQMARGYLNRPELTAEKFVPNPFATGPLNQIMYKTGDLVRWLPDGNLEFLGRIDQQVKIRGYRIELGEIEQLLLKHPKIRDAVVIDRTDKNGTLYLCAYIVKETSLKEASLPEFLARELPEYMIPAHIISLDSIPLTANGKIDRRALPEPVFSADAGIPYEGPRNEEESILAQIWQELLHVPLVSIHDSFFHLGGDSIKAIQVISRLSQQKLKLDMAQLFQHPRIRDLGRLLRRTEKAVEQGPVRGEVCLAPIQHWFFERNFTDSHHWNQSALLHAPAGFVPERVHEVFSRLLQHHDALRMVYSRLDDGTIRQYNRSLDEGLLFTLDSSDVPPEGDWRPAVESLAGLLQSGMDLSAGPLVKLGLVHHGEAAYLIIVIHHLVVDGVSWRILLDDFTAAYEQAAQNQPIILPAKTASYQAWTQALAAYAESKALHRELAYWEKTETSQIPPLPRDYHPMESARIRDEAAIEFTLSAPDTEKLLKDSNRAYHTEINDILLTALSLAIHRWSGLDKIAVTLEGHGREDILSDLDITRTVGWFTSTYPVVLEISHPDDPGYTLQAIKETLRRIPNKGIGSDILRHLTPAALLPAGRSRLQPEIEFNYLGQFSDGAEESGHSSIVDMSVGQDVSPQSELEFLLSISGIVLNGRLTMTIGYSSLHYDSSTIRQLSGCYEKGLRDIIRHCTAREDSLATPSDLGDPTLTLEELDTLRRQFPSGIQSVYPLAPMQEGMLFLSLLNQSSNAYFEQDVYQVDGPLDISLFQHNLNRVVERYDSLRTAFFYEGVLRPRQVVLPHRPVAIHAEDLSALTPEDRESRCREFPLEDRSRRFDLTRDPLIRLAVLRRSPTSHLVVLSLHHIIIDGWCMGILHTELFHNYQLLAAGKTLPDTPPPSYRNYIQWLEKQDKEEGLNYWRSYLADQESRTLLPQCRPVKEGTAYQPEDMLRTLDRETTGKLQQLTHNCQVTFNILIQAIWGLLLLRYNNSDRAVFGSVVSGRSADVPGIEEMLGLFINTIPVRVHGEKTMPFSALLRQMQEDALASEPFSYLPLTEIQKTASLQDGLISHLLAFENFPGADENGDSDLKMTDLGGFDQINYDFGLVIMPGEETLLRFSYNGAVLDRLAIDSIAGHFLTLLDQVIQSPHSPIGNLDIVSASERETLLRRFNATQLPVPAGKTIHQLVEEMAETHPYKMALVCNQTSYTYSQLNQRTNQLAHRLRGLGVKPDSIVSVMVERSADIIIGALAVMKAGGAYLPIDPEYPPERIQYLLEDSQTSILLTQKALSAGRDFSGTILCLDDAGLFDNSFSSDNPLPMSQDQNLVYVIYTSGSTGKPKGVMIEHRNLVNLCAWHNHYHGISAADSAAAYSGFGFDASVWEMFPFLTCGATLHIIAGDLRLSPEKLNEYFETHGITITNLPTQFCEQFMELTENNSLKTLVTGGDKLKAYHPRSYRLINEYGPTEYTISATYFAVDRFYDNIPIGKPLANTWTYVLSHHGTPQPIGIPGELCIAGAQMARGYLNRPELTAEKFVPNPFALGPVNDRLYKTGDLVRWLPDGNLEFLGRIDQQVKIRGYRIELGEIEQQLLKHPAVQDTVVIDRTDQRGEKYLCAYVVAVAVTEPEDFKAFLAKELPAYMIPSSFIPLTDIPLTANGKIDKRALPEPKLLPAEKQEQAEPTSPAEIILAEVWQEVLALPSIGIHDNFFALGGDSIKGIQVISRLSRYHLKLEMKHLFQYPTIAGLAPQIKQSRQQTAQDTVTGEVPLTPIQHWFFETGFRQPHHWNQSATLFCRQGFAPEALETALAAITAQHDALRMVYRKEETGICQYNRGTGEGLSFSLHRVSQTAGADAHSEVEKAAADLQDSLNLAEGPLFKAALVTTDDGDYLLVVAHHLVIDGVSWRIFFEDLATAYTQAAAHQPIQLPAKTDSFKTWSHALGKYAVSRPLLRELPYWTALEKQDVPPLPVDTPLEGLREIRYAHVLEDSLEPSLTAQLLKQIHHAYFTEINDVLLAALGLAVREWASADKVLITMEGHGREEITPDVDISRTVGWFTSTYPVLLSVPHAGDIRRTLQETKETLRRIPRKGIGADILRYLTPAEEKGSLKHSLAPEISFNYLGQFDQDEDESGPFTIRELSAGYDVSPDSQQLFKLDINSMVIHDRLVLEFTFNRKEYRDETIRQLLILYKSKLTDIIRHCLAITESIPTPSDLGDSTLSLAELDALQAAYGPQIDKVYSLAPMQEGMLFLALKDRSSGNYFEQAIFRLEGELDLALFEYNFQAMIQRHDILRTAFAYQDLDRPRQVVLRQRTAPFSLIDLSELPPGRQQQRSEAICLQDVRQGFDLVRSPLIRLTLLRLGPASWHIILSFHHIIMDGWCMGVIQKELFEDYLLRRRGLSVTLEAPPSYQTYIDWLERQDREEARSFWSRYLADYEDQALIPYSRAKKGITAYDKKEIAWIIDSHLMSGLNALARNHQVTLSTVFQGIWGLLLQRYNNGEDVVFGAVVSGRPPQIDGVESMIGLFINTIPVRVRSHPALTFAALLAKMQEAALAAEAYHYYPLAEVQSLTPLKDKLINHLLSFENFPSEEEPPEADFRIESLPGHEQVSYDFAIGITPGKEGVLLLTYNAAVYDPELMDSILGHFQRIAEQVTANPGLSVAALDILRPAERQKLLYHFNRVPLSGEADRLPATHSGPRTLPPLTAAPAREHYPLSSPQRRMFILNQLEETSTAYNMTLALRLEGTLDKVRLGKAIDRLIQRHDVFRTRFPLHAGEPVQAVPAHIKYKKTLKEGNEQTEEDIIRSFVQPFELDKGPLFRVEMVQFHPTRHLVLLDAPHILLDRESILLLQQELVDLYHGIEPAAPKFSYTDYALWQQQLLADPALELQEDYWLTAMAGDLPEWKFPTDLPRSQESASGGGTLTLEIPRRQQLALVHQAASLGISCQHLILGAYALLLTIHSRQKEVIVGLPVSGRNHSDLGQLVGMMENLLPIRSRLAARQSLKDYLSRLAQTVEQAKDNRDYPFDRLVEKLRLVRTAEQLPLVNTTFHWAEQPTLRQKDGLIITPCNLQRDHAQFDIALEAVNHDNGIHLALSYHSRLFREGTMENLGRDLLRILAVITEDAGIHLEDLRLGPDENLRLPTSLEPTYHQDKVFHQLFALQAEKYSDKPALVCGSQTFTYRQLDEQSNRLARRLRQKGVGPEQLVAVMVRRSAELVVAALAIMKAGGVYLPIDPDYPADRISHMLSDSQSSVLLSQPGLEEKTVDFPGCRMDLTAPSTYEEDGRPLDNINQPNHMAYVIYTSGSTGKPKGVMIEHRNLLSFCGWQQHFYRIVPDDNVAVYAAFGFDTSIGSIFPPLASGAAIHIIREDIRLSPEALNQYFEAQGVTIVDFPTQFCEQFVEHADNHSLRYLITGGDRLKVYRSRNYRLINEYGPTECTVAATQFPVDRSYDNIPIGKPFGNTWMYVVDHCQNLQPIGVPGELWIAGGQTARGYLNRPELTAEKFLANPFSTGSANDRIYKTGDLVRWLPDGNLEFLGRIDQQVKIRGYRIELGEIEQQLISLPEVQEGVVVALPDGRGGKMLAAYLVATDSSAHLDMAELKQSLSRKLPDYMLPTHCIQLSAIPVTTNGKIDRRALPLPETAVEPESTFAPPSTPEEEMMARAWKEVLGLSEVSIHDNFFALGGHSIKAISVVAKLQKNFQIAITDLFEHQTIAELARHVKPQEDHLKLRLTTLKEQAEAMEALEDDHVPMPVPAEIIAGRQAYETANRRYQTMDLSQRRQYQHILLTGATGYLGIHILKELLQNPDCHIYAIIRGGSAAEAQSRLYGKIRYYFGEAASLSLNLHRRVTVLTGRLQAKELGLDSETYRNLAETVDCIVHTAANVRHYGPYQDFYEHNVQATLELITLAKTGRPKDFQHVSTISVSEGSIPGRSCALFTEYESDIGQTLDNYYLKTKLEAEKALIAARQPGMSFNIFRAGNISFHSETGLVQDNIEENAFYSQLKAYVNIGMVPAGTTAEFSFVDCTAQAIVRLMSAAALENETYHIVNPEELDLSTLLTDPALGLNIQTTSTSRFIDRLCQNYDKHGFKTHIEKIMLHSGWMDAVLPEGDDFTEIILLSDKTHLILNRLGFVWKNLAPRTMAPMIRQCLHERIGFLAATPLFASLDDAELTSIACQTVMRNIADNTDMLWEGEHNEYLYLIVQGFAEVRRSSVSGWQGTIQVLGPKEFVGEEVLFSQGPSSLTVEAFMGDTLVLALPEKVLQSRLLTTPQISLNLLQTLHTRLRRMEKLVISMS